MVEYLDEDLDKLPVNGIGPMVVVRWIDCTGYDRWTEGDVVKQGKLLECESMGRLVNQDEKFTRLAATRDPFGKFLASSIIPTPNVLEIVYLRSYKKAVKESA